MQGLPGFSGSAGYKPRPGETERKGPHFGRMQGRRRWRGNRDRALFRSPGPAPPLAEGRARPGLGALGAASHGAHREPGAGEGVRDALGGDRAARRPPDAYQMRQGFLRTMGDVAGQRKASANSGMFETTPFTRQRPGEWGSVRASERAL